MATKTYKHEVSTFNPDTGDITYDSVYQVSAVENEDNYIKVYRYLNTLFAFKGIDKKLVPTLIEISCYMSFADKGQEVQLTKYVKEKIAKTLGIGVPEVNKHIGLLKKADVLRPMARGVYAVNPFMVARGKWSDIKELRAQFDFNSGLVTTQSDVKDLLSGKSVTQITQERRETMDGKQMTFEDSMPFINMSEEEVRNV